MTKFLIALHRLIWGIPALVLILGVGIYLTCSMGFPQIRFFSKAIHLLFRSRNSKAAGLTPFQALCTALAATVGTGNLVGVAGAICLGGPGAVFWMWICGFLGMATKFSEGTLAVHYQQKRGNDVFGGPMYMIRCGLPVRFRPLASAYAVFGLIACLGVGNAVQVQSVVSGVHDVLSKCGVTLSFSGKLLIGCILAGLSFYALTGGVTRIGRTSEKLVPIVSCAYIFLCIVLLVVRRERIYGALCSIFVGAFSPKAVTAGALGSVFLPLRVGCSRGVFTNEAGLGTASMAYSSSYGEKPIEKGMLGLLEVFFDTIVICTLTALAVLCSGARIPYGEDIGAELTSNAFSAVFGNWITFCLSACLCVLAFATILGWGVYGIRCAQYLFGAGNHYFFVMIQMGMILISSVMKTEIAWIFSETANGLMAMPNLLALLMLSPELFRMVKEYKEGGTTA